MTHNQRVLALLADGKPHSHHELYALHVIKSGEGTAVAFPRGSVSRASGLPNSPVQLELVPQGRVLGGRRVKRHGPVGGMTTGVRTRRSVPVDPNEGRSIGFTKPALEARARKRHAANKAARMARRRNAA